MIATGRCGWYLRVLAPGTVPTGGPLELASAWRQPLVARHGAVS